jgi:hypothetical protein
MDFLNCTKVRHCRVHSPLFARLVITQQVDWICIFEQLKFNQHVLQHIVSLVASTVALYFASNEEVANFEGSPCTPQNWWHTKSEYEARHGPSMLIVFCLVCVYVTLKHPLFPMPKIKNIIKSPFYVPKYLHHNIRAQASWVLPNLETMFTTKEILAQVCQLSIWTCQLFSCKVLH